MGFTSMRFGCLEMPCPIADPRWTANLPRRSMMEAYASWPAILHIYI